MELDNVFYEFALLLAMAGVVGFTAHWLKQPLIVAFIIVGILVGPSGLDWVSIGSEIELLAKTGIALLLFTVGLRLDLKIIRTMGPVSLATGLGQVAFTSIVGYLICYLLGFSHIASLYIAVALTFSSTIIIVKLLSDKREIDSLHGRIALGFLIVQDLVVVIVMILLTAFGAGAGGDSWILDIAATALRGAGFLAFIYFVTVYALPTFSHRVAKSPELLTILGICWAVALSAIGDWLGFSKEVGAFLAGISLASTPYREALASRLVGLRDFMLLFFFVDLGAHLRFYELGPQMPPAILLSLFVLIGNPFIVIIIMGYMGFRKRTSLLAGLTVAQISEFSLMLGALGVTLGHIGRDTLSLITIVGLITITTSTYMILYSHKLYERISPLLTRFERKSPFRELRLEKAPGMSRNYRAIIFGVGRFGRNIMAELGRQGVPVLGVDFDPDVVQRQRDRGQPVVYGDADDPEFTLTLPLNHARMVISSVPQLPVNLSLLETLAAHGYTGKTATTAHSHQDAHVLTTAGSDIVLLPFLDAAKQAAETLAPPLQCEADDSSQPGVQ